MRRIFLKSMLAGLVALLALAALPAVAERELRLPDLGQTTVRLMSLEEERNLPREFDRFVRANNLLVEDLHVEEYLNDMGYRLVAQSTRSTSDFHFFMINDPSFNAFAMPAGIIGFNAGLFIGVGDESQVAGVLAHEIAHVTQDHIARGVENQQQTSLPVILATIGLAIAASAAGAGGDAAGGIMMGGSGLAQQLAINYTRQNEAEADRVGIGLMARAGYDPHGMARVWETFNVQFRGMGQGPPEYLRTHPLTSNRLAEARSRAEAIEVRGERAERDDFYFVQARLRARISQHPSQAETFFRSRLERDHPVPEALRYGLVLTLIRDRRLDEAEAELEKLLATEPGSQRYRLLTGDLYLAQGRRDEALELLAKLNRQYEGSRIVGMQYVHALMHESVEEDARIAVDVLRQLLRHRPDDLRATEMLARALDRSGQELRAAEAVAESYYQWGALDEAIRHLERLAARDDLDRLQRSRVSARLDEFRAEQAKSRTRRRG